jgi:hypothetical protein
VVKSSSSAISSTVGIFTRRGVGSIRIVNCPGMVNFLFFYIATLAPEFVRRECRPSTHIQCHLATDHFNTTFEKRVLGKKQDSPEHL